MSHFTAEQKLKIFKKYGKDAKDTGSIEAQIALLSERIKYISEHLQTNKKDFSTQKGQMLMIGKRKKLLNYLQKNNLEKYRELIKTLGLRK